MFHVRVTSNKKTILMDINAKFCKALPINDYKSYWEQMGLILGFKYNPSMAIPYGVLQSIHDASIYVRVESFHNMAHKSLPLEK
jgi:hypothetical protein